MAKYLVTDPRTGKQFELTGDSPPTEAELNQIFSGESLDAGTAGIMKFAETMVNNATGLLRAPGELLAIGGALLPGGEGSIGEQIEAEGGKFPASLLRKAPAPTFDDIGAAIRTFTERVPTEAPTDRFRRKRQELEGAGAAAEAAHPIATGAGDVAADVATLLSLRLPFSKPMRAFEKKIAGRTTEGGLRSDITPLADSAPKLLNIPKDFIQSKTMRSLARAAGRSTEAGAEAMLLDIAKRDDPFETAGWVAGGQLAGSGMLTVGKGLLSGGPQAAGIKLWLAAASFAGIIQAMRAGIPGGDDSVIQAVEEGFGKVTLTMALAAVAGVAGSGRLRGEGTVAKNAPRIADAIAAIPRASVISMVEQWVDAPEPERQRIEAEMQKQMDEGLRIATAPPELIPPSNLRRPHP